MVLLGVWSRLCRWKANSDYQSSPSFQMAAIRDSPLERRSSEACRAELSSNRGIDLANRPALSTSTRGCPFKCSISYQFCFDYFCSFSRFIQLGLGFVFFEDHMHSSLLRLSAESFARTLIIRETPVDRFDWAHRRSRRVRVERLGQSEGPNSGAPTVMPESILGFQSLWVPLTVRPLESGAKSMSIFLFTQHKETSLSSIGNENHRHWKSSPKEICHRSLEQLKNISC